MKMIPTQRNYREFNLDNIVDMGPDNFGKMLEPELYSLVLVFRLIDLSDYFLDKQMYEYMVPIRDWSIMTNTKIL